MSLFHNRESIEIEISSNYKVAETENQFFISITVNLLIFSLQFILVFIELNEKFFV